MPVENFIWCDKAWSFCFPGDELDEWIKSQDWTLKEDGKVYICNQEAHIKSKNIAEKIDFESKLIRATPFM